MGVDPLQGPGDPWAGTTPWISFSPPDGSVQDFLGPILAVDRVLQDLYQILYAIQDVEDSLQDINVPGIDHHTLRLSDQVRRLIAATQLHKRRLTNKIPAQPPCVLDHSPLSTRL
jgi:hypothetical protein